MLLIIGMALVFSETKPLIRPGWAIGVAAALVGVSLLGAAVAQAFTLRLHMFTLLRPMGIGILIIMVSVSVLRTAVLSRYGYRGYYGPDIMVTTDVGGKENTVRSCN